MIKRERDILAFGRFGNHNHSSMARFLTGDIATGLHTIRIPGGELDLFYEENKSSPDTPLLIVLPSAASVNSTTYPLIKGRGIAQNAGLPILSISDPAVMFDSMTTGWLLGSKEAPLIPDIAKIIDKYKMGRRLILFGISAGGFPALVLGNYFRDSISFVVNPRTSILVPPTNFYRIAKTFFAGMSTREIGEIIPLEAPEPSNSVFYFQNASDVRYLSSHAFSYLDKFSPSGKVYFEYGDWGEGHRAMPKDELVDKLSHIRTSTTWQAAVHNLEITNTFTSSAIKEYHADIMIKNSCKD